MFTPSASAVEAHWLPACAALAGMVAVGLRRPAVQGTTLVGPWGWSLVALASLGGIEALLAAFPTTMEAWKEPLRLAAAMSTVCPTLALLGAKRPQDRGWQFIVLSLWIILALPSGGWAVYGAVQEIHPLRLGLLGFLVFGGVLNALVTRCWLSHLLIALGQVLVLVPLAHASGSEWSAPVRAGAAALLASGFSLQGTAWPRSNVPIAPLDRLWVDFRDAYGAVWGLRVAQRFNSTAKASRWPVELTWRGFEPATQTVEPHGPLYEAFTSSLLRFVSTAWIDVRLKLQPVSAPALEARATKAGSDPPTRN